MNLSINPSIYQSNQFLKNIQHESITQLCHFAILRFLIAESTNIMLYAFMFSSFSKIQRDKFDEKLIIHLTFTQVKFFSFGFYEHSLLQKLLFESARKLSPGDLLMFQLLTIKSHVCTLYRIQISELLVGLQNP